MKNRAERCVLTLASIAAEILFAAEMRHDRVVKKSIEAEIKKPDFAGRVKK